MITEFGGIAYSRDPSGTWGYSRAQDPGDLSHRYIELLRALRSLPLLAGFCYTQFADTYQESNGLLYADRTPKFPIEMVALATRGAQSPEDSQLEWEWRERVMNSQRSRHSARSEDHETNP